MTPTERVGMLRRIQKVPWIESSTEGCGVKTFSRLVTPSNRRSHARHAKLTRAEAAYTCASERGTVEDSLANTRHPLGVVPMP